MKHAFFFKKKVSISSKKKNNKKIQNSTGFAFFDHERIPTAPSASASARTLSS